MGIEIAAPEGTTTKDKGDLLEALTRKFLLAQNYEVETQVRLTAVELDLLCRHKVNGRKVYVECKAHRDTLGADVLKSLLGTVTFHSYEEGWLVTTGPLGKDAKGFKQEWEARPTGVREKLSIYTAERVIEAFINAGVIKAKPDPRGLDPDLGDQSAGDWLLVVSPYGHHWVAPTLEAGVPVGVIVCDASTGRGVRDVELLKRLSATDCSLRALDFERFARVTGASSVQGPSIPPFDKIVEVAHGESWSDYRPARPKDFVGRVGQQEKVLHLLEDVRSEKTGTRVFAITGDSGMGKSSLIAKLRERTRNKRNRGKYFAYAVDTRAARTSNYILAALLAGLRSAARAGLGSGAEEVVVSDYADPLSSASIQAYLASLKERQQVVCVIFDQFEELYSKPDLFEIFEHAQRLFLSAISSASNLVLGFAWRSDSTVPQDHPAYYMWHRLSDHRLEIALGPFTDSESAHATTLFEKELGHQLHPELRRQLIENSRGYPWLLKKLCIHVYEQLTAGAHESALRETLDAATLFDRDLQQLTQAQQTCVRTIAQSAPADWYEVLELYGAEVLRGLQDRRLVVRSGDRINVYWDIFRDYLLTKRTPAIPFTYVPSSPSLNALLRVAAQLRHNDGRSHADLAVTASLGEKTVGNVVRDLRMFGIAAGEHSLPKLDAAVASGEPRVVLEKIREVLRRHALTLKLQKLEQGSTVAISELADELRRLNPSAKHRSETWRFYAERLALWLVATGLLSESGGGWRREDLGTVSVPQIRRTRVRGAFTGESPPSTVVDALEYLDAPPPHTYSQISAAGYRNAVNVLCRYGVVSRGKDGLFRVVPELRPDGYIGMVWRAVQEDDCMQRVVCMLREMPALSGAEIGHRIGETYSQTWSKASKTRIGNALRRWADWLMADDKSGSIPEPPEGRARR